MMPSLVLRLAGPLQSWGSSSQFTNRDTERFPTRSGVIGLLAAVRGIRRTESLEEFTPLKLGVRLDQPGTKTRDYQTVSTGDSKGTSKLTDRWYLEDAAFLVAIEGEEEFLRTLDTAIKSPYFDIYLGRRACPPTGPVSLGLVPEAVEQVLNTHPWIASSHIQRKSPSVVELETILDGAPADPDSIAIKDVPVSFDLTNRQHRWRYIKQGYVTIPNPHGSPAQHDHDPFSLL